ncbi:MAG: isoprenylcysteine carboxylmethyltransferase family protein [Rhodospirillales bacterium]|nr:isoprenylcysteine carboxylmethyltransferase family protein [Rhodospirillales bacterium]
MTPAWGLAAYAAAWASFGAGHSLLARDAPRAALRRVFGRGMRLAWNAIALVHLGLVLWVGHAFVPPLGPAALPAWVQALRLALGLGGVGVMWAASRSYDMRRLLGTAQLAGPEVVDDEPFSARGLLGWVRHPLYSGGILVLLAGVGDLRSAATCVLATAYILVGLRFEERALLRRFGTVYARYRAAVPALVPWRGRAWSAG